MDINDVNFVSCFILQDLDTLLLTLIRRIRNAGSEVRKAQAIEVARRFVRSVGRVYVVLGVEMAPGKKWT